MWMMVVAILVRSVIFMAESADVVVVGAGVIGCAIAYELSIRGATVSLIGFRNFGEGA